MLVSLRAEYQSAPPGPGAAHRAWEIARSGQLKQSQSIFKFSLSSIFSDKQYQLITFYFSCMSHAELEA